MSKFLSLAGVGLLAACLMLAVPSTSQAQYYGYGYRAYSPAYLGYSSVYTPGFGYRSFAPSYGYYGVRPAIVHPERLHWTPFRGWHTHGHVHVPHFGHYHTFRY